MLATSTCPSRKQLRDYLIGQLSDCESSSVEEHLQNCRCCEGIVEQLDSSPLEQGDRDVLLDFLPQAATMPSAAAKQDSRNEEIDPADAAVNIVDEDEEEQDRNVQRQMESEEPAGDDSWSDIETRKLSSYELVQRIGSGGMGMVYRARHLSLDKWVAVKLLPARRGTDAATIGRFQREMRLVGRLNHPAIVSATDAGLDSGTHFLVMELIDGLDLSRIARAVERIAPADAAEIGRQVALGLDHAHSQGVIHRDIKPSNLMLDGQGQVKLLDLGLADLCPWCQPVDDWTTVGQLLGTLDYMAPEQADGRRGVSHRSDLYSLGATLFRLIAGRPPLAPTPDGSPLEKLRLLATERPPALRTLCPEAPAELARTIDQLLDRDPARRPTSAAAVAEQLAPLAGSADLRALIDRARQTLHDQPDQSASMPPYDAPAVEWPPEVALAAAEPDASSGKRSGWMRRGRRFLAWLTAAAGGAIVLATIWLVLETMQGQLVIETDEADVRVRVVSEGEAVRHLELHPGANATRLRADKYEIVIDQPADRTVMIENGSFELRRGETVIARIRTQPRGTAAAGIGAPGEVPPAPRGAVYGGRTTQQWIDVLRHERSVPAIQEAVAALIALQSEDPEGEIVELVLAAVRRNGLAALNENVPSEQTVQRLLAWLTSPVDLCSQLLQELVARSEPAVDQYGTLIEALCVHTMSPADVRIVAEAYLEVFSELPQGAPYSARIGQRIWSQLLGAEEHRQMAMEIMDSILRQFHDYPDLLLGTLRSEISRPAQTSASAEFALRYQDADTLRLFLLDHPDKRRFSPAEVSSLLVSMARDSKYAEELVPDLASRLPKSLWARSRHSDDELGSITVRRVSSERRDVANRIRSGLERLHVASGIEADVAFPVPDSYRGGRFEIPPRAIPENVDPFHLGLILAMELEVSEADILEWLYEVREQVASSFERIRFITPKIPQFQLDDEAIDKLRATTGSSSRGEIVFISHPLNYISFTQSNRWMAEQTPRSPIRITSLLHAPTDVREQLGLEPIDAEIKQIIDEHLTGYWDYILLTGAINLLTGEASEGKPAGVAEEQTEPEVEEQAADAPAAPAPGVEVVYEGRTARQWIDELRRERSVPKVQEAMFALYALQPEDANGEIVQLVLDAVRRHGLSALNRNQDPEAPVHRIVQQLLARVVQPAELSCRLLRDIAGQSGSEVNRLSSLIATLLEVQLAEDDARKVAETFLEVLPDLRQTPPAVGQLGRIIATQVAPHSEELAEQLMGAAFEQYRDHDELVFGSARLVQRGGLTLPPVVLRYLVADRLRHLLEHGGIRREDLQDGLLTLPFVEPDEIHPLVPNLAHRLVKSMWQDDVDIDRTESIISIRREEYSADQFSQIQERLASLHAASSIESEFGPWPIPLPPSSRVDARHVALVVAVHLKDSTPELLDELRMRLEASRPSFEQIRQTFAPVEKFHQDIIQLVPQDYLQRLRISPEYSAISDGQRFGYLTALDASVGQSARRGFGQSAGRGFRTPAASIAAHYGVEPLDPEIETIVTDHLLGYWDHILITGAINLLTADREEGEVDSKEEEAEEVESAEKDLTDGGAESTESTEGEETVDAAKSPARAETLYEGRPFERIPAWSTMLT